MASYAIAAQHGAASGGDDFHTGLSWPPVEHLRTHVYLCPFEVHRGYGGDLGVVKPTLRLRGSGPTEADRTWTMVHPEDERVTRAAVSGSDVGEVTWHRWRLDWWWLD